MLVNQLDQQQTRLLHLFQSIHHIILTECHLTFGLAFQVKKFITLLYPVGYDTCRCRVANETYDAETESILRR